MVCNRYLHNRITKYINIIQVDLHCLPEDNFKNATAEEATYPHRNHTDIKGSAGIITVQHGGLGAPYQVLRQ